MYSQLICKFNLKETLIVQRNLYFTYSELEINLFLVFTSLRNPERKDGIEDVSKF